MRDETYDMNDRVVKRAVVLAAVLGLLSFALLIRILTLQTVRYDEYQRKVMEQMMTESTVSGDRGSIYDRNGITLATNVTRYRVFISPSSIAAAQKKTDGVQYDEFISQKLSEILAVPYEDVFKQTTYVKYLDRTVKKNVESEVADRVRAFIDENDLDEMIYLEATSMRYYPYGSLAAQVIGFTGSDGTGLYGLEYQYNDTLAGTKGKYLVARDARGNEMPYDYDLYIEATEGNNIVTTLDVFVQAALEEALHDTYEEHKVQNRTCGIVMDVNTGEVLAMGVYPSFDLNSPWTLNDEAQKTLDASGYDPDSEEYASLRSSLLQVSWSNKAVSESYIPGSTFKTVTASMALDENKVTLDETVYCGGSLKISGSTIHCHKTTGHGSLTFAEGIQQSCNVWFMTLGQRIGIESFQKYFKAFGYTEKTGIDLPGEAGSIIASKMTTLDLAIYAFGQNFNVTPIQQITAIGAVANGGNLVTPHLLSSVTDSDGKTVSTFQNEIKRQVISGTTSKTLAEILEDGVSGNGGAKNAYVAGYRIAAKTGTSEKKGAGKEGLYVCSCVGFAPAENPQYAVIIIADEPTEGVLYGSTVAAPYVAQVFENILPYLGVKAVYNEKELANLAVNIPTVIGWSVSAAKTYAESLGLELEVIGSGTYIRRQYPSAGASVEKQGAKIVVYTDTGATPEEKTVPDVIGLTETAAVKLLQSRGFNVTLTGTRSYIAASEAVVVSQSAVSGSSLARGSNITVTLRYLEGDDISPDE